MNRRRPKITSVNGTPQQPLIESTPTDYELEHTPEARRLGEPGVVTRP